MAWREALSRNTSRSVKSISLLPAAAIYYAAMTVLTVALYAADKRAARRGSVRVRERTLHLWTLGGGFVGALTGQWLLRHKSRHWEFGLIAWGALGLHATLWIWWLVH